MNPMSRLASREFGKLAQRCNDLEQARNIHSDILQSRCGVNVYLGNQLMQMYGRCGSVDEALNVFNNMQRNMVTWNIMLTVYAQNGHLQQAQALFDSMTYRDVCSWNVLIKAYLLLDGSEEALLLFLRMDLDGVQPDKVTFVETLEACSQLADFQLGKLIHEQAIDCGAENETSVATALVKMYGKCGCVELSKDVFDRSFRRDLVSWNALLTAYAHNGYISELRKVFHNMSVRDCVSISIVISALGHAGEVLEARDIFDTAEVRDLVLWNSILGALSSNGDHKESMRVYRLMLLEGTKPNKMTFQAVLESCTSKADVQQLEVHCRMMSLGADVEIATSVITQYGHCCSLEESERVYRTVTKCLETSNAMLSAYTQGGTFCKVRDFFDALVEKNIVTWTTMINACSLSSEIYYATLLFEEMPERNLVTWTSMLAAYADNGHPLQALQILRLMDQDGMKPNHVTFLKICEACGDTGDLILTEKIHERATRLGYDSQPKVSAAIVNMYVKCAGVDIVKLKFDEAEKPSLVSWNSLITAYSQSGFVDTAVGLLGTMSLNGEQPNAITFLNILCACNHQGLVLTGLDQFILMTSDYFLTAEDKHFRCLLDLLGRVGWMSEVKEVAQAKVNLKVDHFASTSILRSVLCNY